MSCPPDPATPGPETAGQAQWSSDRLISIEEIRKLFKLGRTAAYELTHRPEFPEPRYRVQSLLEFLGYGGGCVGTLRRGAWLRRVLPAGLETVALARLPRGPVSGS